MALKHLDHRIGLKHTRYNLIYYHYQHVFYKSLTVYSTKCPGVMVTLYRFKEGNCYSEPPIAGCVAVQFVALLGD